MRKLEVWSTGISYQNKIDDGCHHADHELKVIADVDSVVAILANVGIPKLHVKQFQASIPLCEN